MLEARIVTIQNYKEQPSVQHFWVYCSFCAAQKLYWPTTRQLVIADVLNCAMVTDDDLPREILASYRKDKSRYENDWMAPEGVTEPAPPAAEVAFILNMLAATSGVDPQPPLLRSYLPPHWSN